MDMDEKLNNIENLLADGILAKLKRDNLDSGDIKNLTDAYMTLYQANITNKWDQNHKEDI